MSFNDHIRCDMLKLPHICYNQRNISDLENNMKTFGVSGRTLAAAMLGASLLGAVALGPKVFNHSADAQPIAIKAPQGAPLSFADLIERVSPAVISVNVVSEQKVGNLGDMEQFFEQFRGMPGLDEFLEEKRREQEEEGPQTREARSLGSGFFISGDGLVVTNNHVIDGATRIEVVMEDGRELEAELVGTDSQTDLAVLRVKEKGSYPFVRFGDSTTLRKGDWVVALGNPFGLGGTATAGILSADGRGLGRDSPYTDFLQIDASINKGNSGGPTFDLYGNVIGVNTAIFSPTGGSVGIGFAIPAELANEITGALIKDGKVSRGWLGVQIQDFTEDMADAQGLTENEGAVIGNVTAGSPAEKGGLRRGDIILSVNGRKVTDATSTTRVVGKLIANSRNAFELIRAGKKQIVNVTVGERPEDPYASATQIEPEDAEEAKPEGEVSELKDMGGSVRPLDEDTRTTLGLKTDEPGLIITEVDRKGVFADANLAPGLVLLEVNNQPVATATAFDAAVAAARKAGRTKVLIAIRAGQVTSYLTLDLMAGE